MCALAGAQSAAQIDEAAADAFAAMIDAHRELPAVVVSCTLKIGLSEQDSSAESNEVAASLTRLKDGDGLIEINGYTLHINGGSIFATHESNPSQYFALENTEDLHSAIVWDCFGAFDRIPFPHLALFWGRIDAESLYMQFYADTPEHVPTGVRERIIDGFSVKTIDFTGPEGRMEINLDPATNLIQSIVHTIDSRMLTPDGVIRTNTFEFDYETPADFDAAKVAFEPGDRRPILVMASLDRRRDEGAGARGNEAGPLGLVGDWAPPFLLQSADGEVFDLGRQRGRVVVVLFWATWSAESSAAVAELHEVAAWASDRGLPVRLVTVNIRDEVGDTPDDKKEAALKLWSEAGHTLPLLFDYEGEAQFAYRVGGIPTTFVIDPDGYVAAIHQQPQGFDAAAYAQSLRDEIVELLEQ
jgi:peroxiredoxin